MNKILIFTSLLIFSNIIYCREAIVISNNVNIRSLDNSFKDWRFSPDISNSYLNYKIIGHLNSNDVVEVINENNYWVHIKFNRTDGWIAKKYLLFKGLTVYKIDNSDISPGTIIYYYCEEGDNYHYKINFDNKTYDFKHNNLTKALFLPFDEELIMSWVYNQFYNYPETHTYLNQDLYNKYAEAVSLLTNVIALFPNNTLTEDIYYLYINYYKQLDNSDFKGDFRNTISLIHNYKNIFQKNKHMDELDWLEVVLNSSYYSNEGHAVGVINKIKAYDNYLKTHPKTKLFNKIKFQIAELYWYLSSGFEFDEFEKPVTDNFRKRVNNNAIDIYSDYTNSNDLILRSKSKIAIYNIFNNQPRF